MDPAKVLADQRVEAQSLTHSLPYWAVVHGAVLLADGSYELGVELEPLHLDTLGEEELDGVARRLKRLVETLPARERARFIYSKDAGAEALIARHEGLVTGLSGPAAYLARRRIAALRDGANRGQFVGRRLLLSVTYHPPRTRPPRRWAVAALIGGFVAVVVGLLIGWTTGLMLGGGLAGFVHWLAAGAPRNPFTPLTRRELEEDGAGLATLRTIIGSALKAAGMQARPLEDQEYVEWAWRYFNPGRAATGLAPPSLEHRTRTELPQYLTRPDRRHRFGGGEWAADTSLRQMIARSGVV